MGLTVHHLQVSQSERIVWLCEELGLDYTLKLYERAPVLAPAEYKALHPIGAAPVIEDDAHGRTVVLAESEACAEYINRIYGADRLAVSADSPEYADYLYWKAFTNGTLQPAIGRVFALRASGLPEDNPTVVRFQGKTDQCLTFLNERLAGDGASFVGARDRLTLADIMLVFTLSTMRKFAPRDLTPYPNVVAYLGRIAQREAYRRAMHKGDPTLEIDEIMAAPTPALFKALQ